MSDRPMAQRHEWKGPDGVLRAAVRNPGLPITKAPTFAHHMGFTARGDLGWQPDGGEPAWVTELLRVVAERDEARQTLQEMEDAHSEETGERCRAEDSRDALGQALLRYVTGDECGCCDGSPDQPPTPKQCAYCEAQAALYGAGLLPEEEA